MSFLENKVLLEREISFPSIVASKEPSVLAMKKANYKELFAFVLIVVTDYCDKFQPQLSGLKNELAADLIETRDTWKLDDFINCFKWFRQNPTDSNLNMNYERMMNRVNEYEEHRARALEEYHASQKGLISEANKVLDKISPKLLEKFKGKDEVITKDGGMGAEFDRVVEKRARTGKNVFYRNVTPDENYFKSK